MYPYIKNNFSKSIEIYIQTYKKFQDILDNMVFIDESKHNTYHPRVFYYKISNLSRDMLINSLLKFWSVWNKLRKSLKDVWPGLRIFNWRLK